MSVVRTFFTIQELMPIVRRKTGRGVKSVMRSLGIPCHFVGHRNIYFLSDISLYCPELLTSIQEFEMYNESLGIKKPSRDD